MPGGGDLRRGQRAGAVAALHADERRKVRGPQGGRRRRAYHRKARPQGRARLQEEGVVRSSHAARRFVLAESKPSVEAASGGIPIRMVGVLLIQLGTPDAPTPEALRPYLRQFLGDPRVIEDPSWYWPVIFRLILWTRPAQSATKYARIWDKATGSPLLHWTKRQTDLLQARFP